MLAIDDYRLRRVLVGCGIFGLEVRMSKETGGPAFPREDYQCNGDPSRRNGLGQEGISVRDYFAAKALQGELASGNASQVADSLACRSYAIADAMIAARSR